VSKKIFDTFNENLRIFIEKEEDFGLLKISRFSGRNPDGRNNFSAAYAPEKYGRGVHAAAPDLPGCPVKVFLQTVPFPAKGFFFCKPLAQPREM